MKLQITEQDGTQRTIMGGVTDITVDFERKEIHVAVKGINPSFTFKVRDWATIKDETFKYADTDSIGKDK